MLRLNSMASTSSNRHARRGLRSSLRRSWSSDNQEPECRECSGEKPAPAKWSMGVMNDKRTIEVPGSVLLLASDRNEPLGLHNAPARTSHSSIPTGVIYGPPDQPEPAKKKTSDGKIILDPQPDDSVNDPLNWPSWKRDSALLSLGLYCMVGGGITPILAAGFTNVAEDYNIDVAKVSLTTGFYMMGLGLGSVVFSPTAILWGKRPVYLLSAVVFICTSVWCALSPDFTSLILARIFQGMAVSPVECLPSATIAEIFFLHERAFRIGIYTLLLLGGKNLVPLVSAAVIQRLGWRWVFWIVAFTVALCGILLFFFVPETFWDRAPIPKTARKSSGRRLSIFRRLSRQQSATPLAAPAAQGLNEASDEVPSSSRATTQRRKRVHVEFALQSGSDHPQQDPEASREKMLGESFLLSGSGREGQHYQLLNLPDGLPSPRTAATQDHKPSLTIPSPRASVPPSRVSPAPPAVNLSPPDSHLTPDIAAFAKKASAKLDSPVLDLALPKRTFSSIDTSAQAHLADSSISPGTKPRLPGKLLNTSESNLHTDSEKHANSLASIPPGGPAYTNTLRQQPARTFVQQLKPFHGRLNQDKWHKVAIRPLILFSYPAVLWSAVVYASSVGWLIVISESVAVIYRDSHSYNFSAFQTGLVYTSPFIGGVLGTAVAGKISDIIVKAMAKRNGGLYEPEFRLVMAAPMALTTVMGLMGFGWSAQVHDNWIVPTLFFGVVSFGCSLGSTTSITFCVDSYRQYAGEALVTLNFSKNIFHGLVFSLFVTEWITHDGPKTVYIWIGIIQLILLLFTIPMYIYGKKLRMWTVRKNFMEKF